MWDASCYTSSTSWWHQDLKTKNKLFLFFLNSLFQCHHLNCRNGHAWFTKIVYGRERSCWVSCYVLIVALILIRNLWTDVKKVQHQKLNFKAISTQAETSFIIKFESVIWAQYSISYTLISSHLKIIENINTKWKLYVYTQFPEVSIFNDVLKIKHNWSVSDIIKL